MSAEQAAKACEVSVALVKRIAAQRGIGGWMFTWEHVKRIRERDDLRHTKKRSQTVKPESALVSPFTEHEVRERLSRRAVPHATMRVYRDCVFEGGRLTRMQGG